MSGACGAFAKVLSPVCNKHFGQQQDVFPERKRGWEEGPNVDLFLRLSFLFRLSRSRRCVCAQSTAFHSVSRCVFSGHSAQHDFGNWFSRRPASVPSLRAGPLKIWGISCCLTLINAQHLYQPKRRTAGERRWGGDANRLQMAVEFNVLGVKQKKEVGRGTDHVSSVEWKPQKNQLKTQSDIFNQT